MKGKIIELNQENGYIKGEDDHIYFFNKKDLKIKNLNNTILFRPNKEIINPNYTLYKATNIIETTNH